MVLVVPVPSLKNIIQEHHFPPAPVSDLCNFSKLLRAAGTIQDPYIWNTCFTKMELYNNDIKYLPSSLYQQ